MTTIAFDGRYMAADSRRTAQYYDDTAEKLIICPETPTSPLRIVSAAGSDSLVAQIFLWFQQGADPETAPKLDVITGGFIWEEDNFYYFDNNFYPTEDAIPAANGSGSDFAMGAMLQGATAMEAISISIDLDPHTGPPILYVDTDLQLLEIKEYS